MYQSCDGYFQQDYAPIPKAQMCSDWFLEHDNEFNILKWPPQSPDLNSKEHPLGVVEWEIHTLDVVRKNDEDVEDLDEDVYCSIAATKYLGFNGVGMNPEHPKF